MREEYPPNGWYIYGSHLQWDPQPLIEIHPDRDEDGKPKWERPKPMCQFTDCPRPGLQVYEWVWCEYHRKRLYHRLSEIYQHIRAEKAAKKEKDREIHNFAYGEAGQKTPGHQLSRGRARGEVSGGLPSLGKRRP